MDAQIALLLAQDGLTNGAIYALLALALVLVFAVTRVIFIPQGEFVAYGALTLAGLETGRIPGTVWLLLGLAAAVTLIETAHALRAGRPSLLPRVVAVNLLPALLAAGLVCWLFPANLPAALKPWFPGTAPFAVPQIAQIGIALALVVPLGPLLYRLAYQPLASASVLVLLIVSVAVHLAMTGLGLLLFGAEGFRTQAFSEASFALGMLNLSGQTLWILLASAGLITALYWAFEHTLPGKALRATAVNRVGARLMGISTATAGKISFTIAALIGAFSGALISPITTIYFDSGFLVGLKGFVGAIIGGLASYPLAAAGAVLVGLLEAFASFWASAFKEVIVFTLIIPVLLWRSLAGQHHEEDE